MKKVIDQVEEILKSHPETRESDKELTYKVLAKFYGAVYLKDILNEEVPQMETIRRARQRLQADGRYTARNKELRNEARADYQRMFGQH